MTNFFSKKFLFSSSSASSSRMPSPSSSSSSSASSSREWPRGSYSTGSKKKLTRQRKLRHVTGKEFGLGLDPSKDRSQSLPVSPDSELRSPRKSGHWSVSAVPQPLPLPNDDFRLSTDGARRDGHPCSPATASSTFHQSIIKITDRVATGSSRCPTYHRRRGFPEDPDFRLDVVARSAPTTTYSSPALSPKSFRKVNIFDPPCAAPQEFQVSSASEASVFDRVASSTSTVLPAPNPDRSPLHSPTLQSPRLSIRSTLYFSMNSNNKSPPESSVPRAEGSNNVNVYPLPLPPVGSRPTQSTPIRHNTDKLDGSSMRGQWQKGKLIGRGTFGSVYEATNRETGGLCAMKEVDIIPDDSKSAECIKQLEQEIKVLRSLEHPNIVQYLGSEIVEDRFCIYLEYIHPGSINKYVRDHCAAVTECVVRNFTRHIVSGLAYLHSTKTVHRDIKGANLLVDASGIVKLADFGLSKHLAGQAINLSMKGSPHWMAPEVLQSVLRNDANPELAYAVDIWSLGCTVIEMLTGKPPWNELTGVQAMFAVLNKSPPIPEKLSPEGKDFLRLCLQKNPADRATAAMLLEHPFIRNLPDHNVSSCKQEFIGLKLKDLSFTPRDTTHQKDMMPHLPGTWFTNGKLPSSETFSQSYRDASDHHGASSRHSPRSILEVLPSISSSELNYRSLNIGHSNVYNTLHNRAGNNFYGRSRTPGREYPHL